MGMRFETRHYLVGLVQLSKERFAALLHERAGKDCEDKLAPHLSHQLPEEAPQRFQVVLLPSEELLVHGAQQLWEEQQDWNSRVVVETINGSLCKTMGMHTGGPQCS